MKSLNNDTAAFLRSVQRNNLGDVILLLSHLKRTNRFDPGANLVDSIRMEKSGDTALHICARNGFLNILRYLVEEEEANLEGINSDGKTALHDAAQFAQLEVLKYLLANGANVNVVKRADWTPLMLACTKKQNLSVVKALVNSGANLNFVNKDGWNCLHIAAREGNPAIISFILKSCSTDVGKNLINGKSRNGRKPIHTAVMHGHLPVVKLLTADCFPNHQFNEEDNCGSTPLMDACRCGYQNIAEYFIEDLGVSPVGHNKHGIGLLHVAAEANQFDIVKMLVTNYGLSVNRAMYPSLLTPLHWASKEGNTETVKVLLELGASRNMQDAKGRKPRDVALLFAKFDVLELLDQIETS